MDIAGSANNHCPNGHSVQGDDRFCGTCGSPVSPHPTPDGNGSHTEAAPEPDGTSAANSGSEQISAHATQGGESPDVRHLSNRSIAGILGVGVIIISLVAFLGSRGDSTPTVQSQVDVPVTAATMSDHEICFNQLLTATANNYNNTRDEMIVNGVSDPFYQQAILLGAQYSADLVQVGKTQAEQNNISRIGDWCNNHNNIRRGVVDDYGN